MAKQDIIPPINVLPPRMQQTVANLVPARTNAGTLIDTYFARRSAEQQTETLRALVERSAAETNLFDSEKDLIDAYARRTRALGDLLELPEILASERATRRAERAELLRQAQHRYEVAEVKRTTELTHVDALLVDARQALRAQREYGYTTYELAWKKKFCEMLDVELGAAERLAILRQHNKGLAKALTPTAPPSNGSDETIDETLHMQRSELAASGLDTSRIDSLIERRKARR